MKFLIPVAIFLTLLFGLPFKEYETAKLQPISCLQVAQVDGQVRLRSEVGEGAGESFQDAVEDLRQRASGQVFFHTAEQLYLCDPNLLPQILSSGLLRPAAQVYFGKALEDPQGLSDYLAAHPTSTTLATLLAGENPSREGVLHTYIYYNV